MSGPTLKVFNCRSSSAEFLSSLEELKAMQIKLHESSLHYEQLSSVIKFSDLLLSQQCRNFVEYFIVS